MYKTHNCGELSIENSGEIVTLSGWVNRRRDHGGLTFIDLRDRTGLVQIVASPQINVEALNKLENVRMEWVLQVTGIVRKRAPGMENPKLSTGEIEVEVDNVIILNNAKTPPILVSGDEVPDEQLRLRYRYLDLRREKMLKNLVLRHKIVKFIRDYLDGQGFLEVETPILFKTTPEGARDYIVPSRIHSGEFYALPQSPQQLKQLLMVAGIERYFQIARCFRDEDQRGDRQPEFTQLDLEMSFVTREDVMNLIEDMFTEMVHSVVPNKRLLSEPWPRMTYQEAMDRFGKDNPDLRFNLELVNLTPLLDKCGYKVFDHVIQSGGDVRAINVPGAGDYSRKQIDELTDYVKNYGVAGLAYLAVTGDGEHRSSFAKYLAVEMIEEIINSMAAKPGDLILIIADKREKVLEALGRLRVEMGERLGLRNPDVLAFCWIIDFPFVNWNEDENRWDPSHHLFTAPMPEDIPLLKTDPSKARGQQYDLVLNDHEVGGGSIRIHDRTLQETVFELIGLEYVVAQERFGHILEAFEYGTPPHGGIAPGIDRICMILANEPNIREVIAFPKSQSARDLMAGAPSPVEKVQLDELHIKLK